jgi:2-(1,2-epoxy-1,2-dihydrophenyl)acetyl-CoA isomerase
MTDDMVITNLIDGVYTITLNRPKANAFNKPLITSLRNAFKEAAKNKEIRSVVLTANGKLFSAGQDLVELDGLETAESLREHLLSTYNPLILQIRKLEKPVLAVVNGPVAGAALGIVLACDLRIASDNALFIFGFNGIGLAPDSAVSLLLPALIGLGRATEAAFFNKPISAEQAHHWGLINHLTSLDELAEVATQWGNKLAAASVYAMGLTKRVLNKSILPNLEEVLEYESYIQEIAVASADHKEGLSAFLEKRSPTFTD